MNVDRIKQLLLEFRIEEKITDISLRRKDFSDEEMSQVEKLGFINCSETTSWGDRIFVINDKGVLYRGKDVI